MRLQSRLVQKGDRNLYWDTQAISLSPGLVARGLRVWLGLQA